VIEGSIMRSGGRVRITAQLIEAAVDKHLWAQSYEGDVRDALALQSRVARAIAEEIRVNVQPKEQAALKHVKAVNPDAYEAYLEGRYFWNLVCVAFELGGSEWRGDRGNEKGEKPNSHVVSLRLLEYMRPSPGLCG
jgi:hypothetical protein